MKDVLSEYELQAIGHDGMVVDDTSQSGGHYREVAKVSSALEGCRKAEERRVAHDTSTMLLDRLFKEGVEGPDLLMAGMVREGDDASYMQGDESQVGELNGALVRYLEEAIQEQERQVKLKKGGIVATFVFRKSLVKRKMGKWTWYEISPEERWNNHRNNRSQQPSD